MSDDVTDDAADDAADDVTDDAADDVTDDVTDPHAFPHDPHPFQSRATGPVKALRGAARRGGGRAQCRPPFPDAH